MFLLFLTGHTISENEKGNEMQAPLLLETLRFRGHQPPF